MAAPVEPGPGSLRSLGLGLGGDCPAAGLLLIADSLECEGRSLLKSLVASAALREEPVHVFHFEVSESEFSSGLDDDVRARLQFHDGFSDPLNWEESGTFSIDRFTARDLLARIGCPARGAAPQPCSVALDSLSWLLQRTPAVVLCRVLQDFQRGAASAGLKIRKVLGLLHADLHQPEVVEAVCQMASTVVTVTAIPENCGAPREFLPHASSTTLQKRKSGKVLKKEEYFTIEDGLTLRTSMEPVQRREAGGGGDVSVDPAANLTFNLRLTAQERQAKDGVTLPYHFSAEKKTSLLQSGAGQGKIYYEPDAGDDIDEEDPDDDLDI